METRANYGLIGLFTLIVVAIAVAMIYWVGRLDEAGSAKSVQISFPGAVSGLVSGSPVNFNGIRVGTVRGLSLDPDNPEAVLVDVDIDDATPLKEDTAITLGTTGLTGASYVDLRGGSKDKLNLLSQETVPQLMADGSSMDDLLQAARDMMGRVDRVVRRVDQLVETNSAEIEKTIQNAAIFSEALANNADGIDQFLATTSDAAEKISALSVRLEGLAGKADSLISSVNPEQVKNSISNIERFTGNLDDTAQTLQGLVNESRETLSVFNTFGASLNLSLGQLDAIVSAVPPDDVRSIFSNFRAFAEDLETRSNDIDTILSNAKDSTDSFKNLAARLEGEGDRITQITTNAAALSETLRSASDRVDSLFDGLDSMLSSDGSTTLMAEVQTTLAAFRKAAGSFEVRIGEISNGVSRFSGAGLRNLEGLISDGRRAVGRLNSVLQQFESNPRQFISGGGGLPEYNGRPRR